MLPAEGTVRAARRWLDLLERSSVAQAWALLRADVAYTDLSPTQYASALEWLGVLGILTEQPGGLTIPTPMRCLPHAQTSELLFTRALSVATPPWLPDADILIGSPDDIPEDVTRFAEVLGLTEHAALAGIRQAHGKIDAERRAEIGLNGELELIAALDQCWPNSSVHVAAIDDGWGYDIAFTPVTTTWHLEVKTTGRRGRLVIHLSRHEHEVSLVDDRWRLVIVGLDRNARLAALATARPDTLQVRAPQDTSSSARWDSTRHQLIPSDLEAGLPFAGPLPAGTAAAQRLLAASQCDDYVWMPTPAV